MLPIKLRLKREREFKQTVRVTLKIFIHIVYRCGDMLRGPNANGFRPTFVALTALYFLATGSTYEGVAGALREGVSATTVLRHVRLFSEAIPAKFGGLIRFPVTRAAMDQCARSMEGRSGIPGIIGAIDGSHIRVHPPVNVSAGYVNYKQQKAIILSAVVDPRGFHEYRFRFPR